MLLLVTMIIITNSYDFYNNVIEVLYFEKYLFQLLNGYYNSNTKNLFLNFFVI